MDIGVRPNPSAITEVLEALLDRDTAPVSFDELHRATEMAATELTAAIEHLRREEAVADRGDALELTAEGREMAVTVVRRHRLTECLLREVLGLEWWKVHHEAKRWDGLISDELEDRLIDLLGDPGACPHGNPIPGSTHRPEQGGAVLLSSGVVGPVRVVRISEELENDDDALQQLEACGFLPGCDAEVQRHEDGWVEVAGTIRDATLPPKVAQRTYVAPWDGQPAEV